tara:strand:- start:2152 stop:2535 length:384 start_codon:yes stop_codon:yes gene_type:complete
MTINFVWRNTGMFDNEDKNVIEQLNDRIDTLEEKIERLIDLLEMGHEFEDDNYDEDYTDSELDDDDDNEYDSDEICDDCYEAPCACDNDYDDDDNDFDSEDDDDDFEEDDDDTIDGDYEDEDDKKIN